LTQGELRYRYCYVWLLIDCSAWDEIYEVFGDGRDYEWALVEDDDNYHDILTKPDTSFQDVGFNFDLSVSGLMNVTRSSSRPKFATGYLPRKTI
jgi:hypothetical protein